MAVLLVRTAVSIALTISIALALAACSAPQPPAPVMQERCTAISGASPFTVNVMAPAPGVLRIAVRQRGISVAGTLMDETGTPVSGMSPIDRFGPLTFVTPTRGHRPIAVRIRSRDSHDITGEICVTADLLSLSDRIRVRAERAFAAAGQATYARDWRVAFKRYRAAARDFDSVDRRAAAEARHAMADLAYDRLNEHRDSYVLASQALADFGHRADVGLRGMLTSLQARALLELESEDTDARHARVRRLLEAARHLAGGARFGEREIPRLEILLGFLEYVAGNPSGAAGFFTTAAGHCGALRDWECYALAHGNLGAIAEEKQDYNVALGEYADALGPLDPAVSPEVAADIWDNLGRLQSRVGLFKRGEQSHRTAMRLYAQIDNCDGVRRTLARLGGLLVQVGGIGDAIDQLDRAASADCPALMAATPAEPFSTAGANESAVMSCRGPVNSQGMSDDGRFAVFHALLSLHDAWTLEERGDVAERCLEAAHDYTVDARTRLRLANAAGRAHLEQGEWRAAQASFEAARRIAAEAGLPATHENRGVTRLGLARVALLAKQPQDAQRHARESLALSSARADVNQLVDSLQLVARGLRAANETQRAVQTLWTAVRLIEQVPIGELDTEKRATYLATQHDVFTELTDLLIAAAHTGTDRADGDSGIWDAFDASEQGRARSLRYATSQATGGISPNSAGQATTSYRMLMQRIAELAQSRSPAERASISIDELSAAVAGAAPAREKLDSAELRARLDELDAALIAYTSGRHDLFAFVIEGARIRLVRLGDRRQIGAAVANLSERVRNPETAASDVRQAARRVAQLALWPLSELVTRRRIVLVPDEALHTVPFALLPWSGDNDAQLVVHQAETTVIPAARFIMQTARAAAVSHGAARFALLGDPVFRAADWDRECGAGAVPVRETAPVQASQTSARTELLPRLRATREEVLGIAELARRFRPAGFVAIHMGCAATPTALRRAASGELALLHIATHGQVDAQRPRLSALALTRDGSSAAETGRFGLLDILETPVRARLVVLGACDTSRGRLLPGEGVLGPAQAFLQAGAASVIASYWRVDDAATAEFMQAFYAHLLAGRLPVAAALRRAQMEQAKQNAVHVWAAFGLHGGLDATL